MSTNSGPTHTTRVPLARYANYFEVGHNPYEFLIDFGQFRPEVSEVQFHTRLALSPTHAKMLSALLGEAVDAYEAEVGPIVGAADVSNPFDVIFRSLPDFERRAIDARREAVSSSRALDRRPSHKG